MFIRTSLFYSTKKSAVRFDPVRLRNPECRRAGRLFPVARQIKGHRLDYKYMPSLRSSLSYRPQELAFGTSGRRGLIRDLTPLEIYINVSAEIEYLLGLAPGEGGICPSDEFFVARDLRPSSEGICKVIQQAVRAAGMRPVNMGAIPTPALTAFALQRQRGSIMVTGSHIPFDRNGYKLNTSTGEIGRAHV